MKVFNFIPQQDTRNKKQVMTVMIISGIKRFMKMSRILENAGITNIFFYNSTIRRVLGEPIFHVVKFMDFLILGRDADSLPYLKEILDEARQRNIPVISEDRIL